MHIPEDALIAREKLTTYLLLPRIKDDKSRFLAQLGFTQDNPDDLEAAIRTLVRTYAAVQDRQNEYGTFYQVTGPLIGVHGERSVVTLETAHERYGFITLKPDRSGS